MTKMKKGFLHIPIKAKMVVHIIKNAVADNPGISYQSIQEMMKSYAKEYTLTDSIVQDARDCNCLDRLKRTCSMHGVL